MTPPAGERGAGGAGASAEGVSDGRRLSCPLPRSHRQAQGHVWALILLSKIKILLSINYTNSKRYACAPPCSRQPRCGSDPSVHRRTAGWRRGGANAARRSNGRSLTVCDNTDRPRGQVLSESHGGRQTLLKSPHVDPKHAERGTC